jgi:hypothetical protein
MPDTGFKSKGVTRTEYLILCQIIVECSRAPLNLEMQSSLDSDREQLSISLRWTQYARNETSSAKEMTCENPG